LCPTENEGILHLWFDGSCHYSCNLFRSASAQQTRRCNYGERATEQVLDPDGPMILLWTIINETSEIKMELQTNCTGWMGFVFGNDIGQPGAIGDGVIGGYNDELGLGYIEVCVFFR
jgi:hypothetical protein